MVGAWFSAFVFTQLLEMPIYVFVLGRRQVDGQHLPLQPLRWRLGFAFLASMATHPYVWFVIPSLFGSQWWLSLEVRWPALEAWRYEVFFLTAESFAVIAEALILRGLQVPRPLLWALVANMTSAGLGIALRAISGWP